MNKEELLKEYQRYQSMKLNIDMSRGKPNKHQLDLSLGLLDVINSSSSFINENGIDIRNYGELTGIDECKKLFSKMTGINKENILIYGNSSLNIMYDFISRSMTHGVNGSTPWCKLDKIKWLCSVPGYDRHFAITEFFGIEMINIPMNEDGPDMDLIEEYVKDSSVKGIWCVPIYSNPTGITYSDEVVRRFASLKPSAKDFRIYWDEAYIVHHLYNGHIDSLLNIFEEAKKLHNEDIVYVFSSTSKITFAGSGVASVATSDNNIKFIKNQLKCQTLGYDKINQLRHAYFLSDLESHMKKIADILRKKFEVVDSVFNKELSGIVNWSKPHGGYFISLYVPGKAKEVIERCKKCGVTLTDSGCAYPYHIDKDNSHIRIAPSYLEVDELRLASEIIALSVKIEL